MAHRRTPRPDELALARRRHLHKLRHDLQLNGMPAELGPRLRELIPSITHEALTQIPVVVADYGTLPHTATSLFTDAVSSAVANFADLVENRTREGTSVEEIFRQVGRSEAEAGRSLDTLRAAHTVATGVAWAIWATHQTADLSAHTSRLGAALTRYLDYLHSCAKTGHDQASRGRAAVNRLFRAFFDTADSAEAEEVAAQVDWQLPAHLFLCVQAPHRQRDGRGSDHRAMREHLRVLEGTIHKHPTFVARTDHELIGTLQGRRLCPSVIAGPVCIADLHGAHRTARLTLQLMRARVVEPGVLRSPPAPPASWVHDPSPHAAEQLKQRLLPLVERTPHQRAILGRTLLHYMRTRDSTRQIAEALNVHRGTIQNRVQTLRRLFGDEIEPRQDLTLLTALELVVPLWEQQDPTRSPDSPGDDRALAFLMSRKL